MMQGRFEGKRSRSIPSRRYRDTVKKYTGLGVVEVDSQAKNRG